MTFDHRHLIVLGSITVFGLVACEKKENAEQTQTTGATRTAPENTTVQPTTSNTTPGSTVNMPERAMEKDANDATIERITDARCKRELACNKIGSGKKWNDEDACKREVRQNVHSDYRQSECHHVLQDKVQACIDEINGEKCDSVFDLGRMTACRKGNLCKD